MTSEALIPSVSAVQGSGILEIPFPPGSAREKAGLTQAQVSEQLRRHEWPNSDPELTGENGEKAVFG